jgi:uncharacterized membrane protein
VSDWLIYYGVTLALFLAIDMVWLRGSAKRFYARELGHLMAPRAKIGVAFGFYALYVVGIVAFGVAAGVRSGNVVDAALMGALFGLVAYATYDLVNLATLKGFSARLAMVDMAWGTSLTTACAAGGYALGRMIVG